MVVHGLHGTFFHVQLSHVASGRGVTNLYENVTLRVDGVPLTLSVVCNV
jgi:hypothetical protein